MLAQRGAYYPSVSAKFFRQPPEAIRADLAGTQFERLSLQSVHARGQRFVRARCLRLEPPHGRVGAGTGTSGPLSNDRDVYDVDLQCRGHGDSGGIAADADRCHPRTHRQRREDAARSCNINLPRVMPAGLDVAAQESQLAQIAATLPPLLKQVAQLRDLLAVLAGRFPSQAPAENFDLVEPAAAAGSAGEPAVGISCRSARRASGRSELARCQRQDRHRDCESAAQYRTDRQCRQHRRWQ